MDIFARIWNFMEHFEERKNWIKIEFLYNT